LESLTRSRTAPLREVQRAGILIRYGDGEAITDIQRALGVSRVTIYKCIDKALAMGINAGLVDTYHRPREAVITEEARAWVVSVACTKPKDLGYAAELWTRQALANHIREQAIAEGHPSLKRAAKATVHRILAEGRFGRSRGGNDDISRGNDDIIHGTDAANHCISAVSHGKDDISHVSSASSHGTNAASHSNDDISNCINAIIKVSHAINHGNDDIIRGIDDINHGNDAISRGNDRVSGV
jgi:transposase